MPNTLIVDEGKDLANKRIFKAQPGVGAPEDLRLGITQSEAGSGTNVLDQAIPVKKGTILDDGTANLTGAQGGQDSVDDTGTFKPVHDLTDEVAQSLNVNDTSSTKEWTKALQQNADSSQRHSIWLYVDTQAIIDLFNEVEVRFEDSGGDYYAKVFQPSNLSPGWNFLYLGVLADQTVSGSPGTLTRIRIFIRTQDAGDTWSFGEVVYDAARMWQPGDETVDQDQGFPKVDTANDEVIQRFTIPSPQANGFLLDGGLTETSGGTVFNATDEFNVSKSRQDEVIINFVNRIL